MYIHLFFLSLVKRFHGSFRKLRAVIDAEDSSLEVRKREQELLFSPHLDF